MTSTQVFRIGRTLLDQSLKARSLAGSARRWRNAICSSRRLEESRSTLRSNEKFEPNYSYIMKPGPEVTHKRHQMPADASASDRPQSPSTLSTQVLAQMFSLCLSAVIQSPVLPFLQPGLQSHTRGAVFNASKL